MIEASTLSRIAIAGTMRMRYSNFEPSILRLCAVVLLVSGCSIAAPTDLTLRAVEPVKSFKELPPVVVEDLIYYGATRGNLLVISFISSENLLRGVSDWTNLYVYAAVCPRLNEVNSWARGVYVGPTTIDVSAVYWQDIRVEKYPSAPHLSADTRGIDLFNRKPLSEKNPPYEYYFYIDLTLDRELELNGSPEDVCFKLVAPGSPLIRSASESNTVTIPGAALSKAWSALRSR